MKAEVSNDLARPLQLYVLLVKWLINTPGCCPSLFGLHLFSVKVRYFNYGLENFSVPGDLKLD